MKKLFLPITFFSVIMPLVIIIGIPYSIYGLTLSGGESLKGVIALIIVFIAMVFLLLDRIMARSVSPLKVSLIDLALLITFLVICAF